MPSSSAFGIGNLTPVPASKSAFGVSVFFFLRFVGLLFDARPPGTGIVPPRYYVQIGSGASPAFCPMGTGIFPGCKAAGA